MPDHKILKFIHYILAFLWIYQGLFPKLLWISKDEIAIWQFLGVNIATATLLGKISGVIEVIFGLVFIFYPHKFLHYLNILGMFGLLVGVAFILPSTLIAAFNPVVMNVAMATISIIALMLMQNNQTQKY